VIVRVLFFEKNKGLKLLKIEEDKSIRTTIRNMTNEPRSSRGAYDIKWN
jgi:hypothetical protein